MTWEYAVGVDNGGTTHWLRGKVTAPTVTDAVCRVLGTFTWSNVVAVEIERAES